MFVQCNIFVETVMHFFSVFFDDQKVIKLKE